MARYRANKRARAKDAKHERFVKSIQRHADLHHLRKGTSQLLVNQTTGEVTV